MKNIFTIFILISSFFISDNLCAQSNTIKEIRAENQIVSGVKLSPRKNNLTKASPNSVIPNTTNNSVIESKTEKQEKPIKENKYNNNKVKRDEE